MNKTTRSAILLIGLLPILPTKLDNCLETKDLKSVVSVKNTILIYGGIKMKIQKKAPVNHPSKVFWYCKVCKNRREEWKSRKNASTFPFCSSTCKKRFYKNHPFSSKAGSYKRYFTKERFKIWLHNQISIFSPQFTHIRQDHQFRKLVRDEMWEMRKELSFSEAIYFIVFMMRENNIPYIQDKEVYIKVYGSFIASMIMQDFMDIQTIEYFDKAQELLED